MSACIEWAGVRSPEGYGRRQVGGSRTVLAHRYAYAEVHGPIPDGMVVMHSCDNPSCVNPAHLSAGTAADNNADRDRKGRQAHLRGESNGKAILTLDQAQAVAEDARKYRLIASDFGISPVTVCAIKVGRLWPEIDRSRCVRRRTGRPPAEARA